MPIESRPRRRYSHMNITITGATGLIGRRDRQATHARGDEVTVLSRSPEQGAPASRRRGRALGSARRAALRPRRWRPRRGRPPGRRARRPALERRAPSGASASRARSAPATSSPGIAAAEPRPRVLVSRLRRSATTARTATSALDEDAPAGRRLPRRGVRRAGSARRRPAEELGLRVAAHPHRRRARPARRRAGQDAAALQARRRRPGRRRRPVHAVDPRRRRRRHLPRRARRRRAGAAPVNASAPEPVTNKDVLEGARARAAPARRSRPSRPSRCRRSTARWRRSSPRASAWSRRRALELGYAFAHPDLDEALRSALSRYVIAVWPLSAASPAISASRGLSRRCHGLRSCHSAFASLGGITSQMIAPRMREQQARAQPGLLAVALRARRAHWQTIALSSQM